MNMKKFRVVAFALILAAALVGVVLAQSDGSLIYQVSTMNALKQGDYEGFVPFEELGRHGDFGMGTVNGLDGEMIGVDGSFYRITADGKVHSIDGSVKAPFAIVTFFKPDAKLPIRDVDSMAALQALADNHFPGKDTYFYAIRVDGLFKYMKARSVPKQQKPYPTLEDALKNQTVFELKDVRGTMVGFRFPGYIGGVNAAGFHFHFITADKKAGGHVLDCAVENAELASQAISGLRLVLINPEKTAK
jgi:acetolactate decarboxylase